MKRGDRVTEIFAFIATDPVDDCEGIPAFTGPNMDGRPGEIFMPMVGADRERILSLKSIAAQMVKASGRKIRIVRFTNMEELGEVTPEP